MAIMKAIKKCGDCYKEDKCLLTLKMREYCKGPTRATGRTFRPCLSLSAEYRTNATATATASR